jgi:hypothetical protein
MACPEMARTCETVLTQQRGLKAADGIKFTHQLTLAREIILDYPGPS